MAARLAWTLLALVLASSHPAWAGIPTPGFTDTLVVGGLTAPTAIAFLPDGRLLVTEKDGALKLASGGTATLLATVPVCPAFEQGLLGIALDPDFPTNRFVYLYRTAPLAPGCAAQENQVARVTFAVDDTVDLGSLAVILSGIRAFLAHNGGVLRFGPDGMLYVGIGDSSDSARAQDPSVLEGKALRLMPDGSVPPDNPFVGQAGVRGEIFALGLRNPFRFDFDPIGGGLWACDVGAGTMEEIDIVAAGANYAWPRCEGTFPDGCHLPTDTPPIFAYPHSGPTSLGPAILGGTFGGGAFGPLAGHFVFTDFGSNVIFRFRPRAARDGIVGPPVPIGSDAGLPVDFIVGPDGAIYYVAFASGEVRRLATVGGGDALVTGSSLLLRDDPTPERRRLRVMSRDAAVVAATGTDDPTVAGGELHVRASGFEAVYTLPKENWSRRSDGRTLIYRDRTFANGPVRSVVVTASRRVRIDARGAGLEQPLGASDPRPVDVVLWTGMRRTCLRFGGTGQFVPGEKLVANDAAAPAACPE
jgi:glucose/arabinose dehydrogenase